MSNLHDSRGNAPLRTIAGAAVAGAIVVGWVLAGPGLATYEGGVAAANASEKAKQGQSTMPAVVTSYRLRASELLGKEVVNSQGETVGEVDDLIITREDRVAHAIISVGGFLGIGDKLVAVDYDKLRHGAKGKVLLNATKEQLNAYPAFVFADDKASYERRIAQQIDQWKGKVSSYTEEAAQEGKEARKAAAMNMEKAWLNVQQEWGKLKDSSGEAWNATKARFENAWQDFEEAWQDAETEADET